MYILLYLAINIFFFYIKLDSLRSQHCYFPFFPGKLENESKLDVNEINRLLGKEEETSEHKDEDDIHLDPHGELKDFIHNVIVTNASVDMSGIGKKSPLNCVFKNFQQIVISEKLNLFL